MMERPSIVRSFPDVQENIIPGRVDVVFGYGGRVHPNPNHPGNLVYNKLISTFRERDIGNQESTVKETIVESIVKAIQEKGGRFLAIADERGKWFEIEYSQAVSRTSLELSTETTNQNRVAAGMEGENRLLVQGQSGLMMNNLMNGASVLSSLPLATTNLPAETTIGDGSLIGGNSISTERARKAVAADVVATETAEKRSSGGENEIQRVLLQREQQRQIQQKNQQDVFQEKVVQSRRNQTTRVKHETEQSSGLRLDNVQNITEHDVVIAGACSTWWTNNAGNVEYKKLLTANKSLYHSWPEKSRLENISLSIVSTIRDRMGRFLKKKYAKSEADNENENGSSGSNGGQEAVWYDIGDSEAIEWTSELLKRLYRKPETKLKSQACSENMTENSSSVVDVDVRSQTVAPRVTPKQVDVLWARGLSHHPGNLTYRKMVLASMQDQSVLRWDEKKMEVVSQAIVDAIKRDHNGRFLGKTEGQHQTQTVWYEIGSEQAFEKTLNAVREAREKLCRHIAKKEQERNESHASVVTADAPAAVVTQPNSVSKISQIVDTPGETDVVFGGGSDTEALKHPGNEMYRSLISCNTGRYRSCDSEEKKNKICQSIVAAVKGQDGRFLKLNRGTGMWHVMTDAKTIELTSAILQRVDIKIAHENKFPHLGTQTEPINIPDDDENGRGVGASPIRQVSKAQREKTNNQGTRSKAKSTTSKARESNELQHSKSSSTLTRGKEYEGIKSTVNPEEDLLKLVDSTKKHVKKEASEIRQMSKEGWSFDPQVQPKSDEEEYESDDSLVF